MDLPRQTMSVMRRILLFCLACGISSAAIRGSAIQSASNSTFDVNFPAGAQTGDLTALFVGAAYFVDTPAGWTSFGSGGPPITWNGNSFYRVLDASDIATGHVTVTLAGTFQTVIGILSF